MPHQQQREHDERWVTMISAMSNLFVIEPAIVLRRCMPQRVMMRMIGLNQNAAGQVAAAGASSDLSYQLKGALGCAKIRQGQACVNRNHTNQSDVRKIMSLRQHLGPDEQIDFTFAEVQQSLFELVPSHFGVAIDPAHPDLRKLLA